MRSAFCFQWVVTFKFLLILNHGAEYAKITPLTASSLAQSRLGNFHFPVGNNKTTACF